MEVFDLLFLSIIFVFKYAKEFVFINFFHSISSDFYYFLSWDHHPMSISKQHTLEINNRLLVRLELASVSSISDLCCCWWWWWMTTEWQSVININKKWIVDNMSAKRFKYCFLSKQAWERENYFLPNYPIKIIYI